MTSDTPSASASRDRPRPDRLRPTRAGICNIWEYDYQEFRFGDGRLVLRGPNGSGKSNALALLFPFLLDGVMSAARMDALSGGRSMRSLLLCREDDSPSGRRFRHERRSGYLWLEFDGPGGPVTIGAGVRASVQREADAWFFVTRRRVGHDLHLEVDRTPLSRADLVAAIGADSVYDSADSYRAAVDRALFGIGPVRYRKLVELLLVLRRPHLAGKLDVELVSRTLSDGLPALDPGLVADVAQSFDDLESMRVDLAQTRASLDTLERFLPRYVDHLRHQVRLRAAAVDDSDRRRRSLERDRRHLDGERARLELHLSELTELLAARTRDLHETEAEIEAIKDSDAYRSSVALAELEERVAAERRHHQQLVGHLEQAVARREDAEDRVAAAEQAATAAHQAARRALEELTAAALRAGLELSEDPRSWDPSTSPGEVELAVRAGVAGRRVDLGEVRAALDRSLEAERRAQAAEAEAQRADAEAGEAASAAADADATARHAAAALADAMTGWFAATRAALAAVAGPAPAVLDLSTGTDRDDLVHGDGPGPALLPGTELAVTGDLGDGHDLDPQATASAALQPIMTTTAARRAERRRDRTDTEARRSELADERRRVAEAVDPGPPPSATRPQAADPEAPGVPLYACTDFRPGIPLDERPGWEAALHAAGLLDARILPLDVDTGRRSELLDAHLLPGHPDGQAGPSGEPWPTLADVLDPTAGPGVDADTVAAVLASVPLDGELVALGPDGRWRLGPVTGRFAKDHVEFVGAEARERHRQARLAELDADLAILDRRLTQLAQALAALDALDAAVATALASIPPPVERDDAARRAAQAAAVADAAAERASARRREALTRSDAAQQADAELRRQAGRRRLPTTSSGLDAVAADVTTTERTGLESVHRLRDVATARARHQERIDELGQRHAEERSRRAEAVEAASALHQVNVRLDTLRATSGAAAVEAMAKLQAASQRRRTLGGELEQARDEQSDARADLTAVVERTAGLDRQLLDVRQDLAAAVERLAVCRRPEVLTMLGGDDADRDDEPDPEPFARWVLADVPEVGADAGERMKQAFSTVLLDDLRAGFDPMLVEVDGMDLVRVGTDEGDVPVGELAARLRVELARLESLLSDRERQIFETHLLTRVSEELRSLLNDASAFEADVNGQMAGTPTESGMRVSLRWEPNGEHPGIDEGLKLLRRSPELLGPDEREQLRAFFAAAIGSARAADPGRSFNEVLTEVLDYRAWHDFVAYVQFTGGSRQRLTRTVYRNLSGGEAATVIHLPLFAAAAAHYGAGPGGPRIIALDEAFAGIDERMRGRLMGLLVQLDLDCILTSHELWGTYAQVPHLIGYDLLRRPPLPGVGALEFEWRASP